MNTKSLFQNVIEYEPMEKALKILYIGSSFENLLELQADPRISITNKGNILEAVKFLQKGNLPDAILCEAILSGGDGLEMHQVLRENTEYDEIAFILLSYEYIQELFVTAFRNRIDDYYVYPLPDVEKLVSRLSFLKEFRQNADAIAPKKEYHRKYEYVMPGSKRIFDILVASFALILLSPLLLFVTLAIRLESKGKVYYTSKRVGREPFDFYKLRSMRVGADSELSKLAKDNNQYATASQQSDINFGDPCPRCAKLPNGDTCSPILHIGPHRICDYWYHSQKKEVAKSKSAFIKIVNDPRITKVGKIIRNTSIDELPQLINVIKGDMSIVGNRPLPVYEAEQLTQDVMSKRFLAPAGITGLWQVELRGRGGVMSEDERKRLDNEYADHFVNGNYSFWYDIKLILRTIPALFQKDTV
ncbi:MAG: sugar transferase [Bacteroidetes bacterium]|nr:sugar transferase [Bacteroidota bacterium]